MHIHPRQPPSTESCRRLALPHGATPLGNTIPQRMPRVPRSPTRLRLACTTQKCVRLACNSNPLPVHLLGSREVGALIQHHRLSIPFGLRSSLQILGVSPSICTSIWPGVSLFSRAPSPVVTRTLATTPPESVDTLLTPKCAARTYFVSADPTHFNPYRDNHWSLGQCYPSQLCQGAGRTIAPTRRQVVGTLRTLPEQCICSGSWSRVSVAIGLLVCPPILGHSLGFPPTFRSACSTTLG